MTHRLIDVGVASRRVVALSPLLVLGAMAVLIESGWPVLFAHMRLGKQGKPFRCWKIRTMHLDAQARLAQEVELKRSYVAHGYKLPSATDPRVTRVGRWLRRTYLDELPQLFNVLGGTMSLVGPRPIVAEELALYGKHADELLSVKPGLFGAWTCLGPNRPDYPERVDIELDYVRRRSFRRDLTILIRSVPAILRGQIDRTA